MKLDDNSLCSPTPTMSVCLSLGMLACLFQNKQTIKQTTTKPFAPSIWG